MQSKHFTMSLNKQIFKGTTLYRKRVMNNILKVLNEGSVDVSSNWYNEANKLAKILAKRYKTDYIIVSGIIAALSPLKTWDENKKIAEGFLRNGNGKHTKAMLTKAKRIQNYKGVYQKEFILNELNGNKISSFFINIAFPLNTTFVTIDRHAISICLGRSIVDIVITKKQYDFFASCYIDVANMTNLHPNKVQSITWEKWRILKQITDVPF